MLRFTTSARVATYKLPPRSVLSAIDGKSRKVPVTVPTPTSAETGDGVFGVSVQYSRELSSEPYESRMARSTFSMRMEENATLYPMSQFRTGEFDTRYLPRAYPDPIKNRPLLEIGEKDEIPEMMVPVIFLCDIKHVSEASVEFQKQEQHDGGEFDDNEGAEGEEGEENISRKRQKEEEEEKENALLANMEEDERIVAQGKRISSPQYSDAPFQARKLETHYVTQTFMRRKLQPQRLAVYATPENYKLLGLPLRDLKINAEIPKNRAEYQKLRAKQQWDNERWRFSFEMLFRKYDRGPPELLDDAGEDWDGMEEITPAAGAGGRGGAGFGAGGVGGGAKKAIPNRKAKKVKLF